MLLLDAEGAAIGPRKPQDSRSLRHPPRPLLTQPRQFYAHGQVQVTREASHRADEVENVVLVPRRDQLPPRERPYLEAQAPPPPGL